MREFLRRFWFPAALLALLVLALPGALLFALSVAGVGNRVNDWLEDRLRLTYHLPLPSWASLLLLLVLPALIILYFLKLKRKPLSVPSTFLWRKSIEDLHVNSLLQWLRQNVLLLLQLLTVIALLYGVMAFRLHGKGGTGERYIIMIDNSASMAATDVSPSRLEWAKADALKEIDGYTDDDYGMVIAFNSGAEILQSFTSNRGLLRQAVRDIAQTQRTTRIEEGLSLADSLANPLRSTEDVASQPDNPEPGKERTYVPVTGVATEVHLFSDGRFRDLSDEALAGLNSRMAGNESALGNLAVNLHLAGKTGAENVDNVALVTLNAVRDDRDGSRLLVFARALNYRSQAVTTTARLEVFAGGKLRNVYDKSIDLPARRPAAAAKGEGDSGEPDAPGDASVVFEVPDTDASGDYVLHAALRDVHDALPLDDEAWLVVGVVRKARVLIAGPPNDVLQKFFDAPEVREIADVTYIDANALTTDGYRRPALDGMYDLIIFDRCAPADEREMPRSNTLFIGRPPPPWKRESLQTIDGPQITGWKADQPVMRDLRALYTVEVDQAFRLTGLPPRTPLLIEGRQSGGGRDTDAALLVALNRQAFTDLVLAFPILNDKGEWNTTWPLQASFPLFLRNVLYTLGNLTEAAAEEPVQPGQVKVLRPGVAVRRIEVAGPGGVNHTLRRAEGETRPDFAFGATERVGVYRATWDGGGRAFAVNLLDAEESNIEPRAVVRFGGEQVVAGKGGGQPRELWKLFALLALAALMLEWYIYNRRVYV